jgi:2,3-bisphosphoglycerate-dependent phosphoglycerate mutase
MQATRVIAIRHGETEWNAQTRIQGQTDVALNASGAWQASQLPAALADEGIQAVYSSDLQRTLGTAGPLAASLGLAVVPDTGLRERHFGEFEGHTFAEIEARWPLQSERWRRRDAGFGPAGGETLSAFYARAVAAATRLVAAHPGQTVALVTHGGVLDCLHRAATRISLQAPRSWQIANAGIHRLLYSDEGFVVVGWNDVGHLDRGGADGA